MAGMGPTEELSVALSGVLARVSHPALSHSISGVCAHLLLQPPRALASTSSSLDSMSETLAH